MSDEHIDICDKKRLKRKVKTICAHCGNPAYTSSQSSSTASSRVSLPSKRLRKIENMTSNATTSVPPETASWTPHTVSEFVDVMHGELLKGNIYTTSFTPMVWGDIRNQVYEITGILFTVKQLKGKHNRLKDLWRRYSELMVSTTGMGWNAETNLPEAEPFIWEQLGEKNKDFLEMRYKVFPHYLKLNEIFSGRSATGAAARASTQRPVPRGEQSMSQTECRDPELRTAGMSTPVPSYSRSTGNGSRKRKAGDADVVSACVDQLNQSTHELSLRDKMKDAWSVEKIVEVLLGFGDLDESAFNMSLDHFKTEINRRMFMALPVDRQRSYINYRFLNANNK